ncbi:MAG: hypothetical protein M3R13_08250 [Armatimonadota bacterium]|nr:hypothetical protein [Armatimonadota bacterium]
MAYRQQQAVSKPLLIVLVVVVLVGAILFARNMASGNPENEKFEGVPEVPKDLQPPVLPPGGPQPTTGGD